MMKHRIIIFLGSFFWPGLSGADAGHSHPNMIWFDTNLPLSVGLGLALIVVVGGVTYYFSSSRRAVLLAGVITASLVMFGIFNLAQFKPPISKTTTLALSGVPMTVYKTATCGCCGGYVKALQSAGAEVTVNTVSDQELSDLKSVHGIAPDQESCHTTLAANYVIEGHVPLAAVAKLISEKPDITGITLPGMPIGTPGMPGRQTEPYVVNTLDRLLFWESS